MTRHRRTKTIHFLRHCHRCRHRRLHLIASLLFINKLADLKCLLDNESPDCAFVSETWLHSTLPDNLLCSSDYNLYRKDRKTRGSGVCTFIKAVYSSF